MIPVGSSWKQYFYGSAKVYHTFFESDAGVLNKLRGYIGVIAYHSTTRDSQRDMQNFIKITQFPLFTIGAELQF